MGAERAALRIDGALNLTTITELSSEVVLSAGRTESLRDGNQSGAARVAELIKYLSNYQSFIDSESHPSGKIDKAPCYSKENDGNSHHSLRR